MKYFFTLSLFTVLVIQGYSQVQKQIVVEHFTNSVCSICASRNPGFYTNLAAQDNVLHIAIHPSSPYSSCLLNQNNVAENDARTNYYGVYGSTPRLVIQGVVISPAANYGDAILFDPFEGALSPASIRISQIKFGIDSVQTQIIIKTEAAHSLGDLQLFVALAEDTVFYSSPNGEDFHYDVFRKSIFATEGITVNLPNTIGDSIVISGSAALSATWDASRIYTLAILQETSSKALVQANANHFFVDSLVDEVTAIFGDENTLNAQLFPNPVSGNQLIINTETNSENLLRIFNLSGQLIFTSNFTNTISVSMDYFVAGEYLIKITNQQRNYNGKFLRL